MKYFIFCAIFAFSSQAFSSDVETSENYEVMTQTDQGQQVIEVDSETFDAVLDDLTHFYYCKAVPGGFRRCSKRNGRCFGAVFRFKHQCVDALKQKE